MSYCLLCLKFRCRSRVIVDCVINFVATATRVSSVQFSLFFKGAFHQRRSNLGSAEPGSTLIVDLNQVQVMMRSTNVKLGSADVVQLNHDGYTSWTLIGPIWSRSVTSHVLFTLVLIRKARAAASSERLQPPQRFLADRTNGRAIATLLRLSSSSVCLWRYVLWLNGAS